MKQVVVKGESVYECSVCKRKVRVPTNRFGMDVMQRCNITAGCKGKLGRVTQAKDINATPAFPPEVTGVGDWFQRKILYTHDQPIESATWLVKHNLGNKPIVHVFTYTLVDGESILVGQEPDAVRTVDLNTIEVSFTKPTSGLVQCISLASENLTNSAATAATVASSEAMQITSDGSELVIATALTAPLVTLTLSYTTSAEVPNVDIEYADIDTTAALDSPWSGVRRVMVNGRRYVVRSFNLTLDDAAITAFQSGLIPTGSPFRITKINGVAVKQHDVLILLARTPFTTIDRNYDQYVDPALVDTVDPELYWESSKGYCKPNVLRTTYPPILVV